MKQLTDLYLINTYLKAKELHLDEKFISLLKVEIDRRSLDIKTISGKKQAKGSS